MKKTLLYYPTIEIKDGLWLRNAILYWDKVASIVPGMNYDEYNSIEVEYLQDADLYEPIYPLELEVNQELCEKFCDEVIKKIQIMTYGNFGHNSITRVHREKIPVNQMIHMQKVPVSILDYFQEKGIIQRNCDGPWINMNSEYANIYMSTLAKYLSKTHDNTMIGTDIKRQYSNAYGSLGGKIDINRELYLNVAMQKILPVPNMNVAIQDIIDFRVTYRSELLKFRRRIDDYEFALTHCIDIIELQSLTERYKREIDEDIQEITQLFSRSRIQFTMNSLKSLIPISINIGIDVAALCGVISPTLALAANAVTAFGVELVSNNKRMEPQLQASNAYLFYAGKNNMIKIR